MPWRPFIKYPNYENLRPIGSRCYYIITITLSFKKKSERGKRGIPAILVGFIERIDGYRVWNSREEKLNTTKDVCFVNEQVILSKTPTTTDTNFHIQKKGEENSPVQMNDSEEEFPLSPFNDSKERNLNEIKLPPETNLISRNY